MKRRARRCFARGNSTLLPDAARALRARRVPGARLHVRARIRQQATAVGPSFWIGHFQLALIYERLGNRRVGARSAGTSRGASGGNSKMVSLRGYILAKLGRTNEAEDVLRALKSIARERYVPPYAMALVHAGLDQRDAAFEWLERAYEARDVHSSVWLPRIPSGIRFAKTHGFVDSRTLRLHAHGAHGSNVAHNLARVRRILESIVRVVGLIALGAVVASAQPGGQLTGVVRDTTGSVLPGVTVTVTGAALMAPRTVVTDEHGEYMVDALPAGRYLVTAAFSGFEPSSIEIDVGATTATLNVVLAVSSLAERVTVTATKTGAADVQSTPVAITVLPATALDQMGVHSVEGLAGVVPAVTISQHTGLAQVTIRGIGTNSTFGDPSSTVHLDGVYLGRPAMVFADFLNVERVEVVRGPQGTLYGRNSVGGTINIVTRPPINTLETSVRLTAGNYHKLRAEGAVGGPLIANKVMGRFAFLRGTRDGFVHDLNHPDHSLGSEDTWAGRGQLRLILGTQSELLLSGDYGRFDGVPLTYAKPIAPKPDFNRPFDRPSSLWTVRTSDLTTGKNIQRGASAKLAVRLNGTTTLTSLTAYRTSNYRFFIDADATELRLQTSDVPDVQRQVSQELTLVRRTPALTWIGGVFLFSEHDEGQVEISLHPAGIQIRPFARNGTRGVGAVRPGDV